jgi:hypothetical protein
VSAAGESILDRLRRIEGTLPVSTLAARDLLVALLRGAVKVEAWPEGFAVSVIDGRVVAELSPELAAQLAVVLGADADLFGAERSTDPRVTGIGRIAGALGRAAEVTRHPYTTGKVPE